MTHQLDAGEAAPDRTGSGSEVALIHEVSALTLRRARAPTYDRPTGIPRCRDGVVDGENVLPGIFIVDPNSIFRMGMVAYLGSLPGIGAVDGCGDLDEAWCDERFGAAELVIADLAMGQIAMFIGQVHQRLGRPVLVTAESWDRDAVLEAVGASAIGVVCKEGLTAESLGVQVRAALHGAGVVPPQLLTSLAHAGGEANGGGRRRGLTNRECAVLTLIADGRLTREVATELSYSERTVKTVLRDAAVKLGARSRSQAIAYAVREGLI
jgi:DNA-binding NarL/FixJ family response regulator